MSFTKPPLLQRRASTGAKSTSEVAGAPRQNQAPPVVHDVLRSPGQPLDSTTRDFMESRFGQDFSGVRLHTDSQAHVSAHAVSAAAYTVNNHIAFRSGQYSPQTNDGRKLIAHELTHTLQQPGTGSHTGSELTIDDSTSALEKQAEHSEQFVSAPVSPLPGKSHGHANLLGSTLPVIQRQPAPASMSDPARYQQTHDALFTPPTKAGAVAQPAAAPPLFDAAAQAVTKGQFETWIAELQQKQPGAFRPVLPNNTDKKNADDSTRAMDQRLRDRFPQISQRIPEATLLSHISILQDADVAKDDFLRQWLAERLTLTDIATYQLGEKDPIYQKFIGEILADKKLGPLIRELARHKGAYIEESPNGDRDVHLNQGLDSSQRDVSLLHELVHFYAHASYKAWVDTTSNPRFFGEGFTEILARKAMTPEQRTANGSAYQDRVDQINRDITPKIPEDDLARAYFAGEVWLIEGKSPIAKKTFKEQTALDPDAKRTDEKKQSQDSTGISETVVPGAYYRFMNLGDEATAPKPEHVALFADLYQNSIAEDPNLRLRFVGHASSPGTVEFNDRLSLERAKAFYQMARDAGVPETQLLDASAPAHFGKSQPTAGNDDVIGRAFNRRVELFLTHSSTGATPVVPTATGTKSAGEGGIQRKVLSAATAASQPTVAPPLVHDVLRSPGQPLDPGTRSQMERRLGHDFSDVRIHTDAHSAQSARAIQAQAYTVGREVVFGSGHYAPASRTGQQLLAHELTHVVQQRSSAIPAQAMTIDTPDSAREQQADAAAANFHQPHRGPLTALPSPHDQSHISRQPDDAPPTAAKSDPAVAASDFSRTSILEVFDVDNRPNRKPWHLDRLLRQIAQGFASSKDSYIDVLTFYDPAGTSEELDKARDRLDVVSRALIQMAVPSTRIKPGLRFVGTTSLVPAIETAAASGHQMAIVFQPGSTSLNRPKPILPDGTPVAKEAFQYDLDPSADVTAANARLAEGVKNNLVPLLKDPGGMAKVVSFAVEETTTETTATARQTAENRANTVRATLIALGVAGIDVTTEAKFVPKNDARAGHTVVSFVPTPAAKPPESGALDFSKFTTIEISNPKFTLSIKVPKSIEVKFAALEAKLTVPKKISLTLKPVRGIPGLEIGLSGEITKLADLVKTPPAATPRPDGFVPPPPGPPVKFSLSVALNGKSYKLEATASLDVNKRTVDAGLSFSLMDANVKYQVPSSVFDDLNKAGSDLQKAVNKLMGVQNQSPSTRAVGEPPPDAVVPADADLSDLTDALDAISSIADAMDKMDKAREKAARPTLKIGPTITVPYGPTREPTFTDPLGNSPIYGFGLKGTFD